ncbi:hypothetical protein BYT27DRAFT_7222856 [Phlegmacium glaucopus]|nr:hypothetical protein BYT27DRAFT_7222856 [Phlegmacium glaucopus]
MGESPGSHYAADFTSVKAAMEGICENCGATAVLKHMHNKDRSKLGRYLCSDCYQYYRNKNTTVCRSSAQTPQVKYSASHQRDVHKHVAQAQRVMEQDRPVGYLMNTTSGPRHTPGPSVHLPGNIPQYTIPPPINPQSRGSQSVGYMQAHATYPIVRHERIQQAYSTHNAEVVVVEVRMVLMPPGRVQVQLIHDIIEAVDHIPVHIGAAEWKRTLYDATIHRWKRWTNNFPLHIDEIIMRDKLWVILKPNIPDCDVIARHFFKAGKKGTQIFKSGKTIIHFHIPNEIYDAMLEKRDEDKIVAAKERAVAVDKGKKRARSPSSSEQEDSEIEITSPLQLAKHQPIAPTSCSHSVAPTSRSHPVAPTSHSYPIAPTSRSDVRSVSEPTGHAISKLKSPSPSAECISKALKTQRLPTNKEMSSFLCLTTFNLIVHPVECQTWAQLLDQTAEPTQISIGKEGNSFYLGKPLTSTLQLDLTTSNVKKGGFKLAAFGTSMPAVFKSEGVEAICAKCTYNAVERVVDIDGSLTKKVVNVPHEGEKQFQHLMMEVSCLVWAQELLDIVYDFVKEEAEGLQKLPFYIPQLHFVKAAIAIEQSSSTSMRKTTFLLKEIIDASIEGPFRKYLNNVSPEPLMMETKEDEERAKFLAFSQHVQYWKTKKQVLVMGREGNIPSTHRNFEMNHHCNIFCKWFNVPIFKHNRT